MSFRPYNPDTDAPTNQDNDLEPPPDGTHVGCELVGAGAFASKDDVAWVKLEWRTSSNYQWTVLLGVDDEEHSQARRDVTWSQIQKLGINPVDIADLQQLDEALKRQIGSYYDIYVKTNGQYRNTNINGPTTGSNPVVQQNTALSQEQQPATVGGGQDDTDDIPF